MTDGRILTTNSKELTKQQQARVGYIRRRFSPRDGYEFKQFEITKLDDYKPIFLNLEIGLINDKGTMAAVFGRDRYHFCIGIRGGLQSHDGNKFQRHYTRDSDYQSRNKRLAEHTRESK